MRTLLLLPSFLVLCGCHHLQWPHGQVVAPVESATPPYTQPCPPTEVCVDPCTPCYTGEYVYLEPGAAYVVPGGTPGFPPPAATQLPSPLAAAPQTELPGWFDVLPSGANPISPDFGLPRRPVVEDRVANPLLVPVVHTELGWDEIADVVSSYFPIRREQPVHNISGVVTEGFIETATQSGATLLEPHRKDSAGAFNRWQSTLQSVRRRALVRVVPTPQGWSIETQVHKELEDLPRPEQASAGMASLRSDGSLPSGRVQDVSLTRESEQWIALGRDESLEQKMLKEIHRRLTTGK